jgi:methionyl-tRNA formyltransferase
VRRVRDLQPDAPGGGRRLVVACGDGWLELTRLQPEGKPAQTAEALLAGNPALVGAVVG